MDIDLLSKMVKELILDNDKVVLPGLGSFVAEIVPSTFSDKGYTINPPYRRLYFRSKPDEGDALAEFYAESNSVDKEVAGRIIKDYIEELKSVLYTRKTVVFPGLGRLRATKENNVFFVADEDLDIYPAGFGLEPVSLKTHHETREQVSAAVGELKSMLMPQAEPATAPEPAAEPGHEPIVEPAHEVETFPELSPVVAPAEEKHAEPITEVVEEQKPEVVEEQKLEVVEEPKPEIHVEHHQEAHEVQKPNVDEGPAAGEVQSAAEEPKQNVLVKILIAVLVTFVAAVVIYMVVGRLFPEWIDQFLYSAEELEIMRR